MSASGATLRIGTRGSPLALAQSGMIRDALAARHPGLRVDLLTIKTSGDAWALQPDPGVTPDKGMFTREIEAALLEGKIDLAIHSLKDLPTADVHGLELAALPERADARDVLVSKTAPSLAALPPGAGMATGSLRRSAQLRLHRPDLRVDDIRGNIDTRLRKLRENPEWEGLLLAAAGLARLDVRAALDGLRVTPLSFDEMLPAPGQGALALQSRSNDAATRACVSPLDHAPTRAAVEAERAFLEGLGGGCRAPVGAYAFLENGQLRLRGIAWIGDASAPRSGSVTGNPEEARSLGLALAKELQS